MRRFLPYALVAGLFLAAGAVWAGWPSVQIPLQPRVNILGPKTPTKLTAASAGEVHVTLSGSGACVRVSCSVDAAYLTSASASPSTATTDSNQLFARTVERFCLASANDYFSLYLSAAGTCYVAELNSP